MTTTSTETGHRLGRVGTFVDTRISGLQSRYLNASHRDSVAVAALAQLRRGVGKQPGEVLDILEFTLSPDFVPAPDGGPGPDEHAAHTALTLYALHQQSKSERVHRRGIGLGAALRSLHDGDPGSLPDPLVRRFRMLGTADSYAELTHHLRGAVQLLRSRSASGKPTALDYGLLADQLSWWQRGGRERVQLIWGREFYRTPRRPSTDEQTQA
ncbi:CRISPR-associated protein, Cse2 family [Pseudonocardia thermophila]|jgi:CRISPR type I-E/ECOLI-associated protein CasB/Cse2|uniref:CRISPR-associated protein, Cse2 family n=1 Tax=Pseudonocardia thermophila TaxID=1848 RepID=A0A1M6YSM3_PSETH|nr:type I-E CRISPR-associated protein Cse2/CasB [Pseudonocardia thermophila]SHL21276.1 CRISPR-associated protein, Cse2 family [Pseudonocardia thermophila]